MPLFRGFRGKKGSKLTKILVIVLAITFVGGLLYTGTVIVTNPTQAGEIMATVNGRAITRAAFEQGYTNAVLSEYQYTGRVLPETIGPIRAAVFDQYITTLLITEAMEKAKIRVSSKEVEEEFKRQQEAFPSKEEFQLALAGSFMTEDLFKDLIKDRLMIEKLFDRVQEGVTVSEDEIKQAYTDETGNPAEGEEFEEARAELEARLLAQAKENALIMWLEDLRNEADIRILDPELNALVKLQEGDYEGAVLDYESAIELDPDNAFLHIGLAQAHTLNEDMESAISALKEAVALRPEDPYTRVLLGVAYREHGSNELAVEEFKMAAEYGETDILLQVRLESLIRTVGTEEDVKEQQARIEEVRALLEEQEQSRESQEQSEEGADDSQDQADN